MNKKLVAVAVAGLLAAPLAAQAQTANVTLYGRLNMTMEAVNGQAVDPNLPPGSAPVNRTLYRVNSNSSRIGVLHEEVARSAGQVGRARQRIARRRPVRDLPDRRRRQCGYQRRRARLA